MRAAWLLLLVAAAHALETPRSALVAQTLAAGAGFATDAPAGVAAGFEADRVAFLPGQPPGPAAAAGAAEAPRPSHLFTGYVTVDASAGRALFYAFQTSTSPSAATDPLVLWLKCARGARRRLRGPARLLKLTRARGGATRRSGGPGCSSLGGGWLSELGPYFPNADGTLRHNPWVRTQRVTSLTLLPARRHSRARLLPPDVDALCQRAVRGVASLRRLQLQQHERRCNGAFPHPWRQPHNCQTYAASPPPRRGPDPRILPARRVAQPDTPRYTRRRRNHAGGGRQPRASASHPPRNAARADASCAPRRPQVGDGRTAVDMRAFLLNWLVKFPAYARSDLYVAGESYAGHYIPTLASTILAGNALGPANTLNLKGILIGNAWTDAPTDNYGAAFHWWRYAEVGCSAASGSADNTRALRAATT
jgi:hypothetical protein